MAPMLLSTTNSNTFVFGTVQTAGAVGAVAGGIIMSAWGGTRRKVHGVLAGWMLSSLFGMILFGFSRQLIGWAVFSALGMLLLPWINASNQAIWQSKVAPDVQGRVFSARRLIAWFSNPISPILAGTLADFVLEPAMSTGTGPLPTFFGPILGTGPGAGMSVLIILCGVLAFFVGLSGYFINAIRNAEGIMPDYDQLERATEAA